MGSRIRRETFRKHVVKPFFLAVALFAIVGLWRYFDSVWQSAPMNINPFDVTRTIIFGIALATGTIILALFSLLTPEAFKTISRMLGWEEESGSSVSQPVLRSVLDAGELLKCPKCGNTKTFRQNGLVDLTGERGSIKIAGREFSFSAKKQAESIWCEYCGYVFYRRINA